MTRNRTILVLLILLLVGEGVNFPLAFLLDKSPAQQAGVKPLTNLFGSAAASRAWPVRTPHAQPWPAPSQYAVSGSFGYTQIGVWSASEQGGSTTHQMTIERIGWPLPCIERVQMWWPSSDPAWATTAEQAPRARVQWAGAFLNPMIFAASVWLALLAPLHPRAWARRRARTRRGQCRGCGYPLGPGPLCPECGQAYSHPGRQTAG